MNQNENPAMSPLLALGILAAVIAILLIFIGLVALIGVTEVWAGFLFLLYWGGIHKLNMEEYAPAFIGALFGLVLIYLAHHLGELVGNPDLGLALFLALICVLVYFQILGKLHLFNNLAAMLFLTVGTIPQLTDISVVEMGKGIAASAIYFGALGWVGAKLAAKKQTASEKLTKEK